MDTILWKARKRTLFGLPLSFTVYSLTDNILTIKSGFFNTREEEIRLYRIMDITLNRTLEQRLFGLGTIHCCSADKSTPEFDIKRIKNSREVRTLLSDLVEKARSERYVGIREYMDGDDYPEGDIHG
ncbi:MAG: PH domain-containing protein [Ruminococcaceae bacterium]|nr:PH domain-containing protein [Oscillospiraceae bacterium]